MKEDWSKPELVVLVRRMSDEVLGMFCKSSGTDPNGNGNEDRCVDARLNGCWDHKGV